MSEHFRKLENMYHSAPVNSLYSPHLEVSRGKATLTMQAQEKFFHAAGALHGSVYFKALDDVAFFAVNSLVPEHFVVTVSFNLYLLRPVQAGVLRSEGFVTSETKNLFVADAVLYLDDDRVVARGSGSFVRSQVPLDSIESYC
ncbi:MAG: PaaI family thioesterase [Gammaproteobacteria bacterium]|nr:MAG: PaaI family thioesterase [Gammaproteobacteria bacterium]